jgi:hypothetical protein
MSALTLARLCTTPDRLFPDTVMVNMAMDWHFGPEGGIWPIQLPS